MGILVWFPQDLSRKKGVLLYTMIPFSILTN